MGARWVLNIVFLPETDFYSQTPDGNFCQFREDAIHSCLYFSCKWNTGQVNDVLL